jgi:hypothetical protein
MVLILEIKAVDNAAVQGTLRVHQYMRLIKPFWIAVLPTVLTMPVQGIQHRQAVEYKQQFEVKKDTNEPETVIDGTEEGYGSAKSYNLRNLRFN